MNNGYRFAELARGESLQSPDVCDCCGRERLKKTVKLVNPAGRSVWFGVGCAAKAMSVGVDVVRAARKDAEAAAYANEQKARREVEQAADAAWQAFLNRKSSETNRFRQIESLGGYKAAKALFLAESK